MKKKIKWIIITLIVCFLLLWGIELAACERPTALYGNEFTTQYRQTNIISNIDCLKVIHYSETNATVYYVSKGKAAGNMLYFSRDGSDWAMSSWETIWSSSGSADSVPWPYFWHFLYAIL